MEKFSGFSKVTQPGRESTELSDAEPSDPLSTDSHRESQINRGTSSRLK